MTTHVWVASAEKAGFQSLLQLSFSLSADDAMHMSTQKHISLNGSSIIAKWFLKSYCFCFHYRNYHLSTILKFLPRKEVKWAPSSSRLVLPGDTMELKLVLNDVRQLQIRNLLLFRPHRLASFGVRYFKTDCPWVSEDDNICTVRPGSNVAFQSRAPNVMLMSKFYCSTSFALHSAHEKCDV